MLSIFVCEDDVTYQKKISEHIHNHLSEMDFDIELVLSTSNPAKILKHIKNSKVKGLYFLDIELEGGYNGIKIAKTIREYDPRAYIAFITSHPGYMSLTFEYKVEALAYIQKESNSSLREKIKTCIDDAYQKHIARPDEGCFIFKTPTGKQISCAFEEIFFFTTGAPGTNQLIMHTKKRQYMFYHSLEKISTELPIGQFYRCHKSYIINVGNIPESGRKALEQGKDRIIMPNGADCLVSFRKRKALVSVLDSL
ncbi:MAG: LytTR family DNA-binding domain-containing protein [Defluviitaleaceae bacterium]|nr:LytTR family DNA-binding domain-containing protein [Defluviitaleaceae bacterium]